MRYKVIEDEERSSKIETQSEVTFIKTDSLTFSDNMSKEAAFPLISYPLDTLIVTSPFGYRNDPFTGKRKMHNGIDFQAAGDNVYAMMPGKVIKVGFDKVSGNYITIKHGNFTVSYCHLSQIKTNKDLFVSAGDVVGITGNTGRSTGEHLHLTCKIKGRVIDPSFILDYIRHLRLLPNYAQSKTL